MLVFPDSRIEMPELFIPGRKPIGSIRINWDNPLSRGLRIAIVPQGKAIFNLVGPGAPVSGSGVMSANSMRMTASDVRTMQVPPIYNARFTAMWVGRALSHTNWDSYGALFTATRSSGADNAFGIQRNAATDELKCYLGGVAVTLILKISDLLASSAAIISRNSDISTGNIYQYLNGKYLGATHTTVYYGTSDPTLVINGERGASASNAGNQFLDAIFIWDRKLSDGESLSATRKPYQFLMPA